MLLAKYQMLAGNFTEAKQVLKNFQPRDEVEKNQAMELYAKINWLNGQPAKALVYLLDSFAVIKINSKDDAVDFDINVNKNKLVQYRLYSIARLYALLKNKEQAFVYLKRGTRCRF